jgi:competence protein ComEA
MADVRAWRGHIAVVLLNLLALGGAVWLVRDPRATAVRVEPPPAPTAAPTATPGRLHVYVSGAVARPDVVVLAEGARAEDAVEACGGFAPDADAAAVNLAAPLVDGQQVDVPAKGETDHALAPGVAGTRSSGPVAGTAGSTAGGAGSAAGGVININAASAAELDALPGVGPALAARIVAWRAINGPFASPDDLLAVSGIGEKTLARFRDQVTVR